MKRFSTLACLLAMSPLAMLAQPASTAAPGPFSVGENAISFTDATLQSPNVNAHVWYPATSAGTGTPVAQGTFPTVAFGHGFNLNYMDYQQICSHLASWGYVVMSPDVQNGFNVSHQEYARELAACLTYLQAEGANAQSDFFQHTDTMTGVFGHSMGGGASGLVPGVYPSIDAVSGLAAAETNPSAIAALGTYSGPFQAISGSQDNVAPEATNQQAMYNAVSGSQKQWVSITGGAHCKFTDGNTICDLVSGGGSVTRSAQIFLAKKYVTAFFNHALKGDAAAMTFLCGDSLQADISAGRISGQTTYNCTVAISPSFADGRCISISPNPSSGPVRIQGRGNYAIVNALGTTVFEGHSEEASTEINLSGLARGVYFLRTEGTRCSGVLLRE